MSAHLVDVCGAVFLTNGTRTPEKDAIVKHIVIEAGAIRALAPLLKV